MTLTVSVRGHGHDQPKVHLSSVQCDRWGWNMIWRDRDLGGNTTITRTAAGREMDILHQSLLLLHCGIFISLKADLSLKYTNNIMSIIFTLSCLKPHSFPRISSLCFDPLLIPHPFRLAYDSQEVSNYYQNQREDSSNHSSPYKTLPRPPRDPRSMPPTPVMTRNAYSSSQLRCDLCSPALPISSTTKILASPQPQLLPKAFIETPKLCFNNKSINVMLQLIFFLRKLFKVVFLLQVRGFSSLLQASQWKSGVTASVKKRHRLREASLYLVPIPPQ